MEVTLFLPGPDTAIGQLFVSPTIMGEGWERYESGLLCGDSCFRLVNRVLVVIRNATTIFKKKGGFNWQKNI